jgi:hypothetical protein
MEFVSIPRFSVYCGVRMYLLVAVSTSKAVEGVPPEYGVDVRNRLAIDIEGELGRMGLGAVAVDATSTPTDADGVLVVAIAFTGWTRSWVKHEEKMEEVSELITSKRTSYLK